MRILRLDLIAFGPFTNDTVDFAGATRDLHLIYGPNEAGKSSCLRALRQWLYGIPHNSNDNFVHSHANLRIGGVLEHSAGDRIEFVRRKGRDKTIRAAKDEQHILDPAELHRFFGKVDADAFAQRFGIDHQELVRGGAAIADGGGELGDVLFAAGAGIADVRQVLSAIDKELRELFIAGGSKPRINAAIKQLADTRALVKRSHLPTTRWVEHDRALHDLADRLAEVDRQLFDGRSRLNQLSRFGQALSLLNRRRNLQAEFAAVAEAPSLPLGFSERREEATTQRVLAQQTYRDAALEIERLERLIATVDLPVPLLEHRAAVAQLHTDLGAIQKAASDRRRLVAEMRAANDHAERILRDLGRAPDLTLADQWRLPRTERQRIQELAVEFKAILERQKAAEKTLRKIGREIERWETALPTSAERLDPSSLQRAIRKAQKEGDLDQQLADAHAECTQMEGVAAANLKSLPLYEGSLEALERLQVPLAETIERFQQQLAELESAEKSQTAAEADGARAVKQIEQRLEAIRLERDVPTEDELQSARRLRDAGWQLLKRSWREGEGAEDAETASFIQQLAPGGNLADAFQASVTQADGIADRLRREADRVAEKARLTAEVQERQRQWVDEQELLRQTRGQLEARRAEWRALWLPLGIEPLTPREMQSWLRRQTALAESARHIQKHRSRIEELQSQANRLRRDLIGELVQLGRSEPPSCAPLSEVVETCQAAVERIAEANRQHQDAVKQLAKLNPELAEAQQELAQAEQELAQWRHHWSEAVKSLGLGASAAPAEANAVLQSASELLQWVDKIRDDQRRVEGIDRDRERFDDAVRQLLGDVGSDLQMPSEQAVVELHWQLEEAHRNQAKLGEWRQQLRNKEAERERAQAAMHQWQSTLDSLCHLAGCSSADELTDAERRSTQRQHAEQHLQALDEQLSELAAGEGVDAFLAEVASCHADRMAAETQQISEMLERLETEKTEIAQAMGSHRNELARMDGSAAAAEAQEEAERLVASIRGDAEQYVRLRLAAAVLRRAIERFRESSQGPILSRAGQIFAELTLGSFAGLRADYDDSGHAILVGVRPSSGQSVEVTGMSDGTCDQMYLALRLALLESHLQDHEPMPLILDDILIKFDDHRSAAALRLLSQLAARTQVIFFTHHQRLVDLARQCLPPDEFTIHAIDHRRAVTPAEGHPTFSPTRTASVG